jgi:hypothetical protein
MKRAVEVFDLTDVPIVEVHPDSWITTCVLLTDRDRPVLGIVVADDDFEIVQVLRE